MLLTIYVVLQLIAIIFLFFTFTSKSPLISAITVVIGAMLMLGAWQIDVGGEYVWDSSIRAYAREPVIVETFYLATINIVIFAVGLLFFFDDVLSVFREEKYNMDIINGQNNNYHTFNKERANKENMQSKNKNSSEEFDFSDMTNSRKSVFGTK